MEIRLLGALEVEGANGVAVHLPGSRLRMLVASFALSAGRVITSDRLIDQIYGSNLPRDPGNALQALVSTLRRSLAAAGLKGVLTTSSGGYLLGVTEDEVDSARFCRLAQEAHAQLGRDPAAARSALRRALGLWRGEALADFPSEDFAVVERVRLDVVRVGAIEDCIDAELALGRHAEVIAELEQLTAQHRLRERLWAALVVARYRCGRQADALRAFQAARQTFVDELGLEPGPELRRLEAAVLVQDPSLDLRADTRPGTSVPKLPRPLASCLGREAELDALSGLVGRHRLVTVTGPGGAGKTRLALELGLRREAAGGVVVVAELAAVGQGGVVAAVAAATGVATSGDDVPARVASSLADVPALLVLDNCEHVVAEACTLAERLLRSNPTLQVLATSREGLGVQGESLFLVPPLGPETAVQLFLERARLTGSDLALDEAARPAVRDICLRLDGLPLAIELAASRTRALDVTEIARRLNDRFTLLTGGPRTALPRHQTLQAVVDWSYDGLTPSEQLVFERLCVFHDGANLDAAEQVCSGDGVAASEVADILDRLVDKSLVQVSLREGRGRFTLLQTLAEYGRRRLNGRGDAEDADRRLARWASALAAELEGAAYGDRHSERLKIVVAELANVDHALTWCARHEPVEAIRIASRLGWAWHQAGRMDVGWRTLRDATRDDLPDDLAVQARVWSSYLAAHLGEHEVAEGLSRSAVERSRRLGGRRELGLSLFVRGSLLMAQGRTADADNALDEARACFVAAGSTWSIVMTQLLQGLSAMQRGDLVVAQDRIGESVAAGRGLAEDWIAAAALQYEGELAERLGDTERVVARATDAVAQGIGPAARHQQGFLLAVLARMRALQGRHDDAIALADRAVEMARPQADTHVIGAAAYARGVVHHLAGRAIEAEIDLDAAIEASAAQHYGFGEAIGRIVRGQVRASTGRHEAAIADHRAAVAVLLGNPDRMLRAAALGALARSLLETADVATAGLALGAADREHPISDGTWVWDRATRTEAERHALASAEPDAFRAARARGTGLDAAQVLELVAARS